VTPLCSTSKRKDEASVKTLGKCILALLGVASLLFCIGKMKAPDEALAYRERRPD